MTSHFSINAHLTGNQWVAWAKVKCHVRIQWFVQAQKAVQKKIKINCILNVTNDDLLSEWYAFPLTYSNYNDGTLK